MDSTGVDTSRFRDIEASKRWQNAAPFVFAIVLLSGLEMFLAAKKIPAFVFPKPTEVAQAFAANWEQLGSNALITLGEVVFGYLIAAVVGIVVAILITQFPIVNAALTPYTVFLATMPMIALIPLMMIWLGFGMGTRILIVVLQSFPVIMMNAATGFNHVDTLKLELMKSLGAGRRQTLVTVIIPDALPHIFTGLRLAGIFATTAAICCEFSGGTTGLGVQIIKATSFSKMGLAFAGILVVAAMGVSLYCIIRFLERKIVKR